MTNTKNGTTRTKFSERFYRAISLPAQIIALLCDAALAHETLRRALSGSSEMTSILVAVAIAMVIVECSSLAAAKASEGKSAASRALLCVAFVVAAIILVLRMFTGVGSGGHSSVAFAAQDTSWTDFLTNAMVSLLMGACVCATIIGVYCTRLHDIDEQRRSELVELRSELMAREANPSAYEVALDIASATEFVYAVHERARDLAIGMTAILSPEIDDVYDLTRQQAAKIAETHRMAAKGVAPRPSDATDEAPQRHMADAA